jgi:6-pyruvoyl-tetrahydropterin synthase
MGNTWIDPQFQVSDDFDTGELVTYPGIGRKLTGFNVVTSEPWPHCYLVTLAMAEKDDGGFAKFLQELWDYVDDKVNALVVDRYDHKHLNRDIPEFQGLVVTSEILVAEIFKILDGKLPAKLTRVRLFETARSFFEVTAA